MPKVDTVVVGASAGGVEALSRFVAMLPKELPASVLAVLHMPEGGTSLLPSILSRSGPLPAHHAVHGEETKTGRIYCATPGRHLLLHDGRITLVNGPKENGYRPAIDVLFRTAARSRRNRVVGVLLSGMLDDGTMGQWAIRRHGGTTICQDPDDALFGDMPRNAIQAGAADQVLPLDAIGPALLRLVGRDVPDLPADDMPDPTELGLDDLNRLEHRGRPSSFVCPECQGTLFQLAEEGVTHYRCRVGHSYMPDSLAANQEGVLEAALWTAMRTIEEHNDLLGNLLERAEKRGFEITAKGYRAKLEEGAFRLGVLRTALGLGRGPANPGDLAGTDSGRLV